MSSTSYVSAFRAMVAALMAAENEVLGANREWRAANPSQKQFLTGLLPDLRDENEYPGLARDIKTRVSRAADEINRFLQENGLSIKLDEFGRDEFGFAGVMSVSVEWPVAGDVCVIHGVDGIHYPGVHIKLAPRSTTPNVEIMRSRKHGEPIVQLRTKQGDVVTLTKFDKDVPPLKLTDHVVEIIGDLMPSREYAGVMFPMLDLDVKPDVSWLLGMSTHDMEGTPATISQAVQQFRLKMNHLGAVARDGFAGAVTRSAPPPPVIIDDSFLLVFERLELVQPLFAAVIRPDAWKNPGELTP